MDERGGIERERHSRRGGSKREKTQGRKTTHDKIVVRN